MNSQLYSKTIEIPDLLKKHLSDSLKQVTNVNQDEEGYKRNIQLQNAKNIGYPQLKRIKNFFDTFRGDVTDPSFILNGGLVMKSWVNTALESMRGNIESIKRNRTNAGESNRFIKAHDKNGLNIRPSQKHLKVSQRHDTSIANLPSPVMEEVNRINEILKKII